SEPDDTGTKWFTLDATQFIADFGLLIDKLNKTGASAGQSIRVKSDLSGWEFYSPAVSGSSLLDNSVPLGKLVAAPLANYQLRSDMALNAEWFAPLLTARYSTAPGDLFTVPAMATQVGVAHGLGGVPDQFGLKIVAQQNVA